MSVYTLAQIIQGEAKNAYDQFGVASVIQNRAAQNYLGFGSDPFAQATAPNQFSAWPNALQTPSPHALALANALNNGTLNEFGSTGNALFYNAPGTNPAYASGVGNSYGPGTNQYSDIFNAPPSSNFQLPTYGAGTGNISAGPDPLSTPGSAGDGLGSIWTPGNSGGNVIGFGADQGGSSMGYPALNGGGTVANPSGFNPSYMPSSTIPGLGMSPTQPGTGTDAAAGTGDSVSVASSATQAPVQGDLTQFSVAGVNAPAASAVTQAPAPTVQGAGQPSTQGTPTFVTNIQQEGSIGAQAQAKAIQGAGQAVQSSAGTLAAAGTSWLGTALTGTENLFIRGGLLLLALVLIGGAFMFFYLDRQGSAVPV
jgi:hypothetical protein